ncbi:MAG TPA: thiamine pyrophosphate-dependent enzyme [Candidatus Eisenbacteria bacterium]|nr:thiamine pyrophosphate-dependent enzyme [Candidatus Eisenbacteria bacterium]
MSGYKEIARRESCFRPGSTLCPGCMEAVALHNVGRVTDNGAKTVLAIGTSCAEVSSLAFPNVVAWGRGEAPPDEFAKSFGILHNVFESAPTVAEGVRDVADFLADTGALAHPVQVLAASGDGGAVVIGLRALLHAIHRRARITVIVLVNEFFANTGFQSSVATTPFADTSTTPVGAASPGNLSRPMDYVHLAIAAGADLVAQVSPAHGKLFVTTVERALACEGTAVVFVPAPCISGWKFEDGRTLELARLGAQTGVSPVFVWTRGAGGAVKDCERDAAARPPVEEFLGLQRRFAHLVERDPEGAWRARPGHEEDLARFKAWVQENVERLYSLAALR